MIRLPDAVRGVLEEPARDDLITLEADGRGLENPPQGLATHISAERIGGVDSWVNELK